MSDAPLGFMWTDDEHMVPLPRFRAEAIAQFTIGERYTLAVVEDRSMKSHAHYFATLGDIFDSLPEQATQTVASVEHMRKFALIRTGWRDERTIACRSKAEALRLAAFIRPMDEYAIVVVNGATVTVYTAKSQKMRGLGAMNKQDFQRSKDDVLAYCQTYLERATEAVAQRGEAA